MTHNYVFSQGAISHNHVSRRCYHRFMTDIPEKRRDALRSFIRENELEIAKWAKDSHVSANSIYNFLGGRSDSLSITAYGKLARTANAPMWRLTGEHPEPPSPTSIYVVGAVEAGVFVEATEWDENQWYPIDVPVPERFRRKAKALEVRGQSMSQVYTEGSVVIYIEVADFRAPKSGDRVIVYRRMKTGEVEATVKEYIEQDGGAWLWPRSHHPDHQQPIKVDADTDGVETVEIHGIVIGSYKPEIY